MSIREPIQRKARVNEVLRAVCESLRGRPEGLTAAESIQEARRRVPPTESEATLNKSGHVRYDTNLRFWSIDLVKAGWIRKEGGRWYLTPDGERALDDYPDPQVFGTQASRL